MARPRKPWGQPPGRLQATMIKVLAAELSDSARLGRGKQLWAESAVIDIVVGHGSVTAEVQGTRRDPYVVTVEAEPGEGVPHRGDLWVQCTCPDDDGAGDRACKHAVAALFALSDEIAVEPELLQRWRAGRSARVRTPSAAHPTPAATPTDAPVSADTPAERPAPVTTDPVADEIASLLGAPAGAGTPSFPDVAPLEHPPIGDALVAGVLTDALERLRIAWG